MIKSRNSGSIFFIAIPILFSFFTFDKYFQNQEAFESLKYGGEKVTS
jgi:hypothetical protein